MRTSSSVGVPEIVTDPVGASSTFATGPTPALATLSGYAGVLSRLGHLERAEALQAEVLDALRETVGDAHPQSLNAADSLGEILVARGRSELPARSPAARSGSG